ncbi:MAG: MoxR family ATPase, partial [Deltaproteobacteria bacterium]
SGVGKTELAQALATLCQTELIRLQCYEGLDVHSAVYEWNYQKQLLAIRLEEASGANRLDSKQAQIFSEEFLLERPLLSALRHSAKSPVLLIDEVDRADEEFEAFLLELLSVFQITIPELGTVQATHRPHVVLTSNRTRELSDALKRRCLYHWIGYPDAEQEQEIVRQRLPQVEADLARQTVQCIQSLRELPLSKSPGVAETLDWAQALLLLNRPHLDELTFERTMGCVLKSTEDQELVRKRGLDNLLTAAVG